MPDPTHPAQLTIERCRCAYVSCQTYGFKEGTFYQGCGFEKETAERVAASYNACVNMDNPQEIVRALLSFVRDYAKNDIRDLQEQKDALRAREILSHIRS